MAKSPKVERRKPPVHPGERLREEFLKPFELSANALALAIRVPATRVSEIVNERRGITTDTAIRLGLYFGTQPEFWVDLQMRYELRVAEDQLMPRLKKEVQPRNASARNASAGSKKLQETVKR
jgi:addiction module HigA family antidote